MSFIVSGKSGGGDFAPHPAGVFAARCTKIVDLGTEQTEYKGEKKSVRKLRIYFESEALMPDGDKAGQPFLVTSKYTRSLGEKAILRKDLESWRGRKFTPQEIEGFDIKNVLGKGCMLNIVHDTKNGKTYANIASIMPLPPSMRAPQAVGELVCFDFDDFQQSEFDKLGEKMREHLKTTPEYKALFTRQQERFDVEETNGGGTTIDDDIPF